VATPGTLLARNGANLHTGAAAAFFLPTEGEWYTAADYDPAIPPHIPIQGV
jgi:hypothetical protein